MSSVARGRTSASTARRAASMERAMVRSSLPSGATGIQERMPEPPFGARRPPPVADVPPAALADGIVPAKGWLLALIAARALHDAPAVPTAELARDAPKLCAAILRATGSDAKLELPPVAARAGAMAG